MNIVINNHQSRLVGPTMEIEKVRQRMAHKAKNYFWSEAYQKGQWDGFIRYVTPGGLFLTGLLGEVIETLSTLYITYTLDDKRILPIPDERVVEMGEYTLRDYQDNSSKHFFKNKLKKLPFPRGIMNIATNGGKTITASSIMASYPEEMTGIFLINNKTIFNQLVEECIEVLGKEQIGWVSSEKGVNIKRFTVCMVQTLANRAKKDIKLRNWLASNTVIMVDEADEVIHRNDTKFIISHCYNAPVRLAFTGTALLSKDKQRNNNLIGFFGPIISKVSNKDLVEAGVSAEPIIKIHKGNEDKTVEAEWSWQEEYLRYVVKSKKRNRKVWKRVAYAIKKDRIPVLILIKLHQHAKELEKTVPKEISDTFTIKVAHGGMKDREHILSDFKSGKIDILICSMIIRRGKNVPGIITLINAAAGDSHENILQLLGRGLRKSGVKDKVYVDEFYDEGKYLRKHSKHRIIYYKNEGFEVKSLHNKKPK